MLNEPFGKDLDEITNDTRPRLVPCRYRTLHSSELKLVRKNGEYGNGREPVYTRPRDFSLVPEPSASRIYLTFLPGLDFGDRLKLR